MRSGLRTPRALALAVVVCGLLTAGSAHAYPVDASEETGIERLEAYDLASRGELRGTAIPLGALLPDGKVQLRLLGRPDFEVPRPDPGLEAAVRDVLGADAPHYGVALLDLSRPGAPRYAEVNGSMTQNPGSVGKVVVALALFQALADAHPDDIDARRRILHDTRVVADSFIRSDDHLVPFYVPGPDGAEGKLLHRPVAEGDAANLWTWLDWMLSASSNAAASTVLKQVLLLSKFGNAYPVDDATAERFLATTPKAELTRLLADAIDSALRRSGLNTGRLRQGSFFTRTGKERVPGGYSVATANELMRFLVRMEQGKLVDPFSSREIKKLLYLTEPRLRYSSAPELDNSAVYFKSGSLYSCRPESGYVCKKYQGNRWNFMNSIAVVEGFAYEPPVQYIVVVLSNVLKKDSESVHRELGGRIHQLIVSFYDAKLVPEALAPKPPEIATTPALPAPLPTPSRAPPPSGRRAIRR
jgi:hypothetical protein